MPLMVAGSGLKYQHFRGRQGFEERHPVRLKDVDDAQTEIVAKCKDLSDSGEIIIADGGDEGELVY